MKYSSIFDIPLLTRIRDAVLRYTAAVNCAMSPPSFVYWFKIVISFVQLVGPCLLLSSTHLWDQDSVVYFVMRVIAVFWQGWIGGDAQLIISTVFLFISLVYLVVNMFRIHRFYHYRVMSEMEAKIQVGIAKGFRTILLPLEICGVIHAYNALICERKIGFMELFVAIFAVIIFCFEVKVLSDTGIRILMEPSFSYSLCPWYLCVFHGLVAINCCLSSVFTVDSQPARGVAVAIMAVIYFIIGFVHWYFIPTISCFYSLFLGSCSFGCVLLLIVNLVCLHVGKRIGFYSVLWLLGVVVISAILAAILKNRYPVSVLGKLVSLEDSGDDIEERFAELFPGQHAFARAIRISFAFLDPFILSWKPFTLALRRWPNNYSIIVLWAKCLAIFPSETKQLKELMKSCASTQKETGEWLMYQLQIYRIVQSRVVHVPTALASALRSLSKSIEAIKLQQRRLMVNIMKTYTALFWQDLDHINRLIEELDIQFYELLDKFPNNQHVIDLYLQYIRQTKFDPQLEREWVVKQNITREGGRLVDDIGYVAAASLFPDLPDVCLFPEGGTNDAVFRSQTEGSLGTMLLLQQLQQESTEERHENQMLFVLHDLTKHSRVASITTGTVLIIFGIILSCVVFYFCADSFNGTVDDYMNKVSLLNEIGFTAMESAHFASFVAIGAIQEKLDFSNETLAALAPTLMGQCNALPEWSFSSEDVTSKALSVRSCLERLGRAFTTFGTSDAEVTKLYNQLFVDEYQAGLSFQDHYMQLIYDVINLFQNTSSTEEIWHDERFRQFSESISTVLETLTSVSEEFYYYSEFENDDILRLMKDLIALNVGVIVVLIGLPFIVSYFSLVLVADAIADSFSSISVTAIKEVINRIGLVDEKEGVRETNETSAIQGAREQSNAVQFSTVVIAYSAALMGMIIIGLVLFFLISETNGNAWKILKDAESLHFPLTVEFAAMHQLARLYTEHFIMNTTMDEVSLVLGRKLIDEGLSVWSASFYGSGLLMTNYGGSPVPAEFIECTDKYYGNTLTSLEKYLVSNFPDGLERQYLLLVTSFDGISGGWTNYSQSAFPLLVYPMMNWQIDNRDYPYVNSVYDDIARPLQNKRYVMVGSVVAFVLYQFVAGLILIAILVAFHSVVRQSLQFFMYFKPSTILQNTTLVSLLSSGSLHDRHVDYKFKYAESVLLRLPMALVICDKNLMITDHNFAFLTLVESNEPLVGTPLTDVLVSEGISTSIDAFLDYLQQVLDGHVDPTFGMEIRFSTKVGKLLVVSAHVISLVAIGAARTQEDFSDITGFAIILEDLWPRKRRAEKIAIEEKRISDIMKTVIPEKFIERFKQELGYVSFGIGAGCFGRLRFYVDRLPTDTDLSYLDVFDRIYKHCNSQIRIFPKILKVRSFAGFYEVASVQNEIGEEKRDKWLRECAMDLMAFAAAVYKGQQDLERQTSHTIKLTVALNASPAILSGIYTADHPSYQILGTVLELTDALEAKAAPGDFFAGQSLFELVHGTDSAYKSDCMGQIQLANYQEAYYRYTLT